MCKLLYENERVGFVFFFVFFHKEISFSIGNSKRN